MECCHVTILSSSFLVSHSATYPFFPLSSFLFLLRSSLLLLGEERATSTPEQERTPGKAWWLTGEAYITGWGEDFISLVWFDSRVHRVKNWGFLIRDEIWVFGWFWLLIELDWWWLWDEFGDWKRISWIGLILELVWDCWFLLLCTACRNGRRQSNVFWDYFCWYFSWIVDVMSFLKWPRT